MIHKKTMRDYFKSQNNKEGRKLPNSSQEERQMREKQKLIQF